MAKKKNAKRSGLTRGERRLRSLLILLMTVAALWGGFQLLVPKPAAAENVPPMTDRMTGVRPSGGAQEAAGEALIPAGPDLYERKKDCWTFLLVGMDKGGGNTDTLMLVTYDVANQTISVGSIARDTRVDVSRSLKKINAAYALGGGMDGLIGEVSLTFGVPVDYYLRVNVNGFVRLVNAVGGVDFYVPCNMDYDDPYQDLSIHYVKGTQHLNGRQALEVCRFRQNSDGGGYGDEGRQATQRALLTAVLKKVLANPGKIDEYVQIASENLDTNLKTQDIIWFAARALGFNMENLHAMSMPCEWISPYMYLDPDATLEMINEYFNPYTTPRTADMLDIVTRK